VRLIGAFDARLVAFQGHVVPGRYK